MNIETMAASSVSEALSKSDYLFPNIHIGDREPSWDGDIEVYNKATPCHKKSDLIRRIPVQIKGKIVNRIREKDIKYPIQVADMRNFLQEGGAVFFVVLMEQDGENKQIYYVNLLPFDLKKLLSDYGSQKARNIELKKLPSDKEKITDIFLTCASDMKKQMPTISSKSITIDELRDLKALSIGCTCVFQHKQTPFDYFFNHGAYLYAKMPYDINLPVGHIERINSVETSVASHVTVNKKHFIMSIMQLIQKIHLNLALAKVFNTLSIVQI